MAAPKSKSDKLFSAAVLRRSFELRGDEHKAAFQFVYDGVLRDLGIEDSEVKTYLEAHRNEIEAALGRPKLPDAK